MPGTRDEDGAGPDLAAVGGEPADGNRGAGGALRLGKEIGEAPRRRTSSRPPGAERVMSGKGCAGGSKRGGTPRSGATRSMMLPVTGPAFQPAVAKP